MALLLLLSLGVARAQPDAQRQIRDPIGLLSEYRGLVDVYRRSGVDGIRTELLRWDAVRINDAISTLSQAHRSSPFILDTTDGRADVAGWSMPLVGAAALLHTDLFLAGAKTGAVDQLHLQFATRLLAEYTGPAADISSRLRITLITAWIRQILGDRQALRAQLLSARQEFPKEPALALAEGCLEEAAASPRAVDNGDSRRALARAEGHYRRALSIEPGFAEARVRLGFVLLRLGRAGEASRELQHAVDDTRDAYVSYLGMLLLGAVREHMDRFREAIEAYRKAREIGPACQVAAVALSQALYRSGDRPAAAAVVREAATMNPAGCEDAWWSYDFGQARKIDEAMAVLRRAMQP